MHIEILRHGETTGGSGFRGRLDDPLSAQGWGDMWAAIELAKPWMCIISSPLRRCAEFAQVLSHTRQIPLYVDARWRELDFGDWEGRTAAQLWAENPEILQAFWANPTHITPPHGESLIQLHTRVLAAWNELLQDFSKEKVLIISHGGPIRVLWAHLQRRPLHTVLEYSVPYAALIDLAAVQEAI